MAFLLTMLAGISTMVGCLPIFIKFKDENKIINMALSFAAGIMISVCLFDLLPECFKMMNNSPVGLLTLLISINIGILVSMAVDRATNDLEGLYKIGIISTIALIMHNIPEGIATYIAGTYDIKLGITLAFAIAMHNIPEGITIALPIYYSTRSKTKAILYTLISGLSEIFGALIASLFVNYSSSFMIVILGIISGLMFYIAIYELIPASLKYNNKIKTMIWSGVGVLVIIISTII